MIDIEKIDKKYYNNMLKKIDKENDYKEFSNFLKKYNDIMDFYKLYFLYIYINLSFEKAILYLNNVILSKSIDDALLRSVEQFINLSNPNDKNDLISYMDIVTINNKKYIFNFVMRENKIK